MTDLFHVLNRGVDKRTIFADDRDHMRFMQSLRLFNDTSTVRNIARRTDGASNLRGRTDDLRRLVDIHGWCLMRNHYHLLLSERVDGGLTKFIMRLNVGYAKYFNKRYDRSGTLFQGRSKKIHIDSDGYFLHILHYIHLNPLDFDVTTKDWRAGTLSSSKKSRRIVEQYRWSSYADYASKSPGSGITTTELFSDVFRDYPSSLYSYLRDMDPLDPGIALE
jgi:putative transposase